MNMATTIRFEPEIENRLNHLADATGRTKTFYLKEMGELIEREKRYDQKD